MIGLLNKIDAFFDALRDPLLFLCRLILFPFYFFAGIEKIQNYDGTLASLSSHGIPAWTLPFVIALEVLGPIFLILGLLTRLNCLALITFTVVANFIYNRGGTEETQQFLYMAEYTIVAAFVALLAVGPGRWSVDALWRRDA